MNNDWNAIQNEFVAMLIDGVTQPAIDRTRQLLNDGITPIDFFQQCITPAMVEIGNRFETLEIFLPEMVVAAEIVQQINAQVIHPALATNLGRNTQSGTGGKVALASVQGDLHDIGKNIVALMLEVNGFEVTDLGTNVPPSEIVDRAQLANADIIGLSSLLTTCLPYMKDTVDLLNARGIRDKYAVIIGGAAPTAEFAKSIGADYQGHSAAEAVTICKDIMLSRQHSGT